MYLLRSLRVRLIASLVLIVGITLGAAGVTLYARFAGYQQDLTTASLKQIAAPIYYNFTVPSQFTTTQRGGMRLREELLEYIRAQRRETGVYILLLNADGRVIEDYVSESNSFGGEVFLVPPPPERAPNFNELPEGSYTTVDGERLLYVTVAMPQQIRRQEAGVAAIVVALPQSAGPPIYKDLRQRLALAGLVGGAAAILTGFLVWLSVYRPLARVTAGLRAVARGDYKQRVPEQGPIEVKALAQDVNAMAAAVDASRRTLREFLANVSHELKTPLTSIGGFSQALQDGTLESKDERDRAARVIESESRRLLQLVGELLDLSRIESGQQRMDFADVRMPELLLHIREVFALRAEAADVRLDVDTSLDATIWADFDRIEQVLGNLLDNAFRHSKAGDTVTLAASEAGGAIRVLVRDQGQGILASDLPHVFDRFYRSADETAGSGAGLGLAIAREIVRAHGGQIEATSPEGGGTAFTFTIPAVPSLKPPPAPDKGPNVNSHAPTS